MSETPLPQPTQPPEQSRLAGRNLALVASVGILAGGVGMALHANSDGDQAPVAAENPSQLITPNDLGSFPKPLPLSQEKPVLRHKKENGQHIFTPVAQYPAAEPVIKPHRKHTPKPKPPHEAKHEQTEPAAPILEIPTDELPALQGLKNFHPESLSVSAQESQIMRDNAVYLQGVKCSGMLVRNPQGLPIGVKTAKHCLMPYSVKYQSGQYGLNFHNQPVIAETGDSLDAMTPTGTVTSFAFNPDDMNSDTAYGAFDGQSMQDVMTNAVSTDLPAAEIANLPQGTVIKSSGFPLYQSNNSGPLKRQEFAMTVLGTTDFTVDNGEHLQVLLAAVPESKDGAECSWGSSGMVPFVLDGNRLDLGTASAFNDFGKLYNKDKPEAAAQQRAWVENTFGVSMDGYTAICGFSFKSLIGDPGMVTANVITNTPGGNELPPIPEAPQQQLEKKFQEDFFDPGYSRHIINGLVQINTGKGDYWVDKPAFVYDQDTQSLLLGFYSQGMEAGEKNLYIAAFPASIIEGINVYDDAGQPADLTTTSTGALQPTTDSDATHAFTDANGLIFGSFVPGEQTPLGAPKHLAIDQNSQLILSDIFQK